MPGQQHDVTFRFLAEPGDVPAWEPRDDTGRGLQDYARRLIEVSRRMQQEVGGMRPPLRADGGHD